MADLEINYKDAFMASKFYNFPTFPGAMPFKKIRKIAGADPHRPRGKYQILTTIGLFKSAIKLDPDNADAKLNLELVLQDPQTETFVSGGPGGNPDAGRRGGTGSGGQGY